MPGCALPGTPLADALPGINACVHCGFCLQACPTYLNLEDENDSPRGRIFLMRSLLEGTVRPDDPSVQQHIDQCLGCRACEPVCPSGVPYGQLLEATRATLREYRPVPFVARLILFVFARSWLLATGDVFLAPSRRHSDSDAPLRSEGQARLRDGDAALPPDARSSGRPTIPSRAVSEATLRRCTVA